MRNRARKEPSLGDVEDIVCERLDMNGIGPDLAMAACFNIFCKILKHKGITDNDLIELAKKANTLLKRADFDVLMEIDEGEL